METKEIKITSPEEFEIGRENSTLEEKELLLKDLSSRLPYGVKFKWCDDFHIDDYYTLIGINEGQIIGRDVNQDDCLFFRGEDKIKPYLRPMSSMTEEEKFELKQEHVKDQQLFAEVIVVLNNTEMRGKVIPHFAADWCDKKMFDYRGLIPKGLAIAVTEENSPYKD